MRKKILQLLVPGLAAGLVLTGCAHSRCCPGTESYETAPPPSVVRQPATINHPCGEVGVREPAVEACREVANLGATEYKERRPYEHYWVAGYWAATGFGWMWIPPHEEATPNGPTPTPPPATNSMAMWSETPR